jgi:transglutaminase-like putative cysteine protease
MKLQIRHLTRHTYPSAVSFGLHSLYLRPLESHRRRVDRFEVKTIPESTQRWVRDVHGNIVLTTHFGLRESTVLEFKTSIDVTLAEDNPFDFILESYATAYPFRYRGGDLIALLPFLAQTVAPGATTVMDWFKGAVPRPGQHDDVVRFLSDLNEAIHREIAYVHRDEEGIQDPDITLSLRTGSCRDMAVLFMAIVRQLGFAARFASGYLYDPPVGKAGEHAFNRAVGSMHAWAEIYLPGAGWKGFDPTNGILANGFFVPSAVSHEPSAVDPIQGSYFSPTPTSSTLEVKLEIEEIAHG